MVTPFLKISDEKREKMPYLFVSFAGEKEDKEQVYFSVSQDGLFWKDLNQGHFVLESRIGTTGVRDPFIIQDPNSLKYYVIATDLKMSQTKDWKAATDNGSKAIIAWESDDLINWSKERSCQIGIEQAGCVWAPEAIYDQKKKAFLVYWASNVREEGELQAKQRIYASYTKDFHSFEQPFKFIERENDVIDTTIIQSGEFFYRFSKNETSKTIELEEAPFLETTAFKSVPSPFLDSFFGIEGPQSYQLEDGSWILIVDQFLSGKGYVPLLVDDLANGMIRKLADNTYNMGKLRKRHGSVIAIKDTIYEQLIKFYGF